MKNKKLKRLAYFNRQPTLWRHSIPAVRIVPSDDEDDLTIGVNPLLLEPMNMDFDGDTAAIYIIHDEQALEEINEKAFIKSYVHYDQSKSFLSKIRHEALYAAYILTSTQENMEMREPDFFVDNLQDLEESIEIYNTRLDKLVQTKSSGSTYGVCLFNKWCGFDDIVIYDTVDKKKSDYVSKMIYNYYNHDTEKFYKAINNLEKHLLFFISCTKYTPTLNVKEMIDLLDGGTEQLFKMLPDNNVILGYHINEALVQRCLDNFDNTCDLYKLYKSGSRFSKSQLARSCINIGYSADANNIIQTKPIKSNLLKGLTKEAFFQGSDGSRKSIYDKQRFVPQSGYLERTIVMALSKMTITEDDCYTTDGITIDVINEAHAETLIDKWYAEDIDHNSYSDWKLITEENVKDIIGKKIKIRSPMTCGIKDFNICQRCFGERQFPTKYVGITAGQSLTERITQLIMRTFHTSGSAELDAIQSIVNFLKNSLVDIEYRNGDIILYYDTTSIPKEIREVYGFKYNNKNTSVFEPVNIDILNKDAVDTLTKVKNILKSRRNPTLKPEEYYMELMKLILGVGKAYSSFIEMLFAHMFITKIDKNVIEFWRYNQSSKIVLKIGDKSLASKLSPLLGLLYQPNSKTIGSITDIESLNSSNDDNLSIYERIYLGKL